MRDRLITTYETKHFVKFSAKLIGDKERERLIEALKTDPKAGDVIPGTSGLRKLRWKRPGTGKRGGVRVIYYFYDERGVLVMLTVYAKNDKEDMSAKDKKEYRALVDDIIALIENTYGGKHDR